MTPNRRLGTSLDGLDQQTVQCRGDERVKEPRDDVIVRCDVELSVLDDRFQFSDSGHSFLSSVVVQ